MSLRGSDCLGRTGCGGINELSAVAAESPEHNLQGTLSWRYVQHHAAKRRTGVMLRAFVTFALCSRRIGFLRLRRQIEALQSCYEQRQILDWQINAPGGLHRRDSEILIAERDCETNSACSLATCSTAPLLQLYDEILEFP